jgi:ATP-dependent Clp protease ATP-binding subunit ClpX
MEGIKLHFTNDALSEIARQALTYHTGARALRSVLENFMLDIMFSLPDKKGIDTCTITKKVITSKAPPRFTRKRKKRAQ